MARLRSKTAAHCLLDFQTDYAGTDQRADKKVTLELMEWADVVVCMENHHRSKLRRKFKGFSHKMRVWNVPDEYDYMSDSLVNLVRRKSLELEVN